MSIKFRKMSETYEVPEPDDLIQGDSESDKIVVTGTGDIRRGTLLISTSESAGKFMKATSEASLLICDEMCILCEDVTGLEAGDEYETYGYFRGKFKGTRVILPYETDEESHEDLIESIISVCRKRFMYMV